MPVKNVILAVAAFLFLASVPTAALAARQDAGEFSVEMPPEWTFENGDPKEFYVPCVAQSAATYAPGELKLFAAKYNSLCLSVLTQRHKGADLAALAEKTADGSQIRMLDKGLGYVFEEPQGARAWGMLADDGLYFVLRLDSRYAGIADFIKGMRAGAGQPGMEQILKAAASPGVLDWLGYRAESFATPAKEPVTKTFTGSGVFAKVPEGWAISEKQGTVTFTSPDGKETLSARKHPGKGPDENAFMAFGEDVAKKLGANETDMVDGDMEFTDAKGRGGLVVWREPDCLVILHKGESDALVELLASVRNGPDQ